MIETPKGNRLHISIFGRRNVGKSSIINALTNQPISIVSNKKGTTTDPVYKAMELLPIGPVMIIDTAGIDDIGQIGNLRIKKTEDVMDKTDLAILVFDVENKDFIYEKDWYKELKSRKIPIIGVVNKVDIADNKINIKTYEDKFKIPFIKVSALNKVNIDKLKDQIISNAPFEFEMPALVSDIVKKNQVILLIAPQDIQAPKGRLILPQVQTIRDLLDNDSIVVTIKDSELEYVFKNKIFSPDLVITDSQIFKKVNEIVPKNIKLTSFSILMARFKGDLKTFIQGAKAISKLKPFDKVLIAEACTHHPLEDDIAKVQIPKLLQKNVCENLDINFLHGGASLPDNIKEYKLIIHCGACMFNRKQMMSRIYASKNYGVNITNYGIAMAYMNGILGRVTEVF